MDEKPTYEELEQGVRRLEREVAKRKEIEERLGDLRKTEEALRVSEERLRLALEGTTDGIWDWNLETGEVYFSPRCYTMLGYEPDEFLPSYESWRQLLHPDDVELSEKTAQQAIEDHSAYSMEFRLKTKSGEWRWILGRGKVVESDASGKAVRMAGSHTDITERKQAEAKIRESEEKYRLLFDTTEVLLSVYDREGVCQLMNRRVAALFGGEPEDFIGKSIIELHPKDGRDYIRSFHETIDSGVTLEREDEVVFPWGSRWLLTRLQPLPNEQGVFRTVQIISQDITERKQAEEALRESAEHHRIITNTSMDGFVVTNSSGKFVDVNEAYCRMLGYSRDELLEMTVADIEDIETSDEIHKHLKKITETGADRFETRHRRKDGRIIDVEVSITPIQQKNLQLSFVRDITARKQAEEELRRHREHLEELVEDRTAELKRINEQLQVEITERKQAEAELRKHRDHLKELVEERTTELVRVNEQLRQDIKERKRMEHALRESEERFRHFSDAAFEAIIIHEGGIILSANDQFYEMHGYESEELMGKQALPLTVAPEMIESTRKEITTGGLGPYESIGIKKDGTRLPVEIRVREWEYEGRKVRVAAIMDITERKRAEEELHRLRNLLRNIVDSMPSVLVAVDNDVRVTQWNREVEKVTGITADKAQGRTLTDVFPQLAGEMIKVRQAIRNRELMKDAKVPARVNGETRYSDVTIYPLVADGVGGAVIRVDDVTERVRMEEMMIQSEKMLSVGGLAAGMAHEINNPLAAILQNAQVVVQRTSKDLPTNQQAASECSTSMETIHMYMEKREILKMLEAIQVSGERAAKIVENMLNFSRKSESAILPHVLSDLLDNTVELASSNYDLKKKYDFRKIEILREYEPNLPEVPCERTEIQQVILNLLKNATESMAQQNERGEQPRITLRTSKEDDTVRIEVEDNGSGMNEAIRRRIFEPFFTTKDVGVGTGLGLSISYFIITENHGGTMEVKSAPGEGTKFIIHLPLKKSVRV